MFSLGVEIEVFRLGKWREWASRPPDERYANVSSLYQAACARRERTEELVVEPNQIRTEASTDGGLALRGRWPYRVIAVLDAGRPTGDAFHLAAARHRADDALGQLLSHQDPETC